MAYLKDIKTLPEPLEYGTSTGLNSNQLPENTRSYDFEFEEDVNQNGLIDRE